jgi:hypothetical protein
MAHPWPCERQMHMAVKAKESVALCTPNKLLKEGLLEGSVKEA